MLTLELIFQKNTPIQYPSWKKHATQFLKSSLARWPTGETLD